MIRWFFVALMLQLSACAPTEEESGAAWIGPAVAGLDLERVVMNQGVDVVMMANYDDYNGRNRAPIITGRKGLMRVYVQPQDVWRPRMVRAILTLRSGDLVTTYSAEQYIGGKSTTPNLDSTFNFEVDAEDIYVDTVFDVSLHELNPWESGPGTYAQQSWSSEGYTGYDIEQGHDVKLVIFPVRYNADGSGRLPALSDKQIQRYRDLFEATYPLANLKIKIEDPMDVSYAIGPSGNGWNTLLGSMSAMRSFADEPDSTYYYALFKPDTSIERYCAQGCILGLSLIGGPNDVWSRASMGLGFAGEESAETMVHEVGHAHGREHAPCGLYGQPFDPNYPYSEGDLGTWGYDARSGEMRKPSENYDMMSYCDPLWVSDYTYAALHRRISTLNSNTRSDTYEYWPGAVVMPDGSLDPIGDLKVAQDHGGEPTSLQLIDGLERNVGEVTGYFTPFSHMDGGVVIYPPQSEGVTAVKRLENAAR